MTLKASPLSNRGVRLGVPPVGDPNERTLEECPNTVQFRLFGHPFRVQFSRIQFRGYSLCSHPRLLSGDAFSVYSTFRSTKGHANYCYIVTKKSVGHKFRHFGGRDF